MQPDWLNKACKNLYRYIWLKVLFNYKLTVLANIIYTKNLRSSLQTVLVKKLFIDVIYISIKTRIFTY